ncbi:rhomboid family intramembrane serine protease [soil metagenome]
MFPISDDNSDRRIQPVVNYGIIGLNILVFLVLQRLGSNDAFTYAFSLVPREIVTGVDLTGIQVIRDALGHTAEIPQYATPFPVYFNFLSSMFMHGGIAHIFGNMLFLFIFGDNIENLIGHFRFAAFYLLCGFAAAVAQIAVGPDSVIPMLGASGAISGVLGGYALMFPKNPVRALVFNFMTTIPAFVAIGIWIVYQLILGFLTPSSGGGVAYAAHIGGFVTGLALIKVFSFGKRS